MRFMQFENATFRNGLNFTVRLDPGWTLDIGEKFWVAPGLVATCSYIIKCRLCDVPWFVLVNEHDPECVDIPGLTRVMNTHYNGIQADAVVTAIGFMVDLK
jgi:hypothetical protein